MIHQISNVITDKWGNLLITLDGKNYLIYIEPRDLVGIYLDGEVKKKRTRTWFFKEDSKKPLTYLAFKKEFENIFNKKEWVMIEKKMAMYLTAKEV